jgi:hypothetical protein
MSTKRTGDPAAEDTEGHRITYSNRDLKKDVKPVERRAAGDANPDAAGHMMHWSNRDLKKDVKPVERKA